MSGLRYSAESNGYTVLDGGVFIGRVRRVRDSYEHSNGRTYHFWVWYAYPVGAGDASFSNRTRAAAARYLQKFAAR